MFESLMERLASFSHEAAQRTTLDILNRLQQAVDFPFSGRVVPEYGETNFREIIIPPYRLMYRVRTNGITVEVVVHGAWKLE